VFCVNDVPIINDIFDFTGSVPISVEMDLTHYKFATKLFTSSSIAVQRMFALCFVQC